MHNPISTRGLIISFFIAGLIVCVYVVILIFHKNSTVIFCDVGQGDGAYVRIHNTVDVLIDTGPENSQMLNCLGRHMPFYDRTIEAVILSHPQKDHVGGLYTIGKRYHINYVYISEKASEYNVLLNSIRSNSPTISVAIMRKGDRIVIHDSVFTFLWPPGYLVSAQGNQLIPSSDKNLYSSAVLFQHRNSSVLFTGDNSSDTLSFISKYPGVKHSILKVAHHGSKNGTSRQFLQLAEPTLAVISVGKDNRYGHPNSQILELFEALHVPVRRTDQEGDIVIDF